ncbi:MAG: hypothetical protein M3259_04885 [Actinomycetota bacterium]|nr:hypothetical protein [Actinomycetota bacterium]
MPEITTQEVELTAGGTLVVARLHPDRGYRVKFPIDPEDFFVKGPAIRPEIVSFKQPDLIAVCKRKEDRASVAHMAQAEGSTYRGIPPRSPPRDLRPRGSKTEIFRRSDAGERRNTNEVHKVW